MRGSRPLVTVALACLLVLAGCSGGGGGADMAATQASLSDAGDGGGAEEKRVEATGTPAEGTPASGGDRMRIRTAEFRIRVDEFEPSRENLSTTVQRLGGYASSVRVSSQERGNETFTDAQVVYRVPAENYSKFTAAVRAEGMVLSEQENVDDVTRRHADLEARLESLKAERERLRELYEQANDTEAVLAVQRELADVQRQIETIQARLRTLENQVAYSTITVSFREERPDDQPVRDHWYDTGVVAAFLESVDGVVVTVRALVVGLAYALPYLAVFGLPAYGLFVLFGRIRGGGVSVPFLGGESGGAEAVDEGADEK